MKSVRLPSGVALCGERCVADMRTVDGRNLLGMSLGEVDADWPPAQGRRHQGADLRLAGAEVARARPVAGRRQGRLRLFKRPARPTIRWRMRSRTRRAGRAEDPRVQLPALSRLQARRSCRGDGPADRARRTIRHHDRGRERTGLQHRLGRRACRLSSASPGRALDLAGGRWSISATGNGSIGKPPTDGGRSSRPSPPMVDPDPSQGPATSRASVPCHWATAAAPWAMRADAAACASAHRAVPSPAWKPTARADGRNATAKSVAALRRIGRTRSALEIV